MPRAAATAPHHGSTLRSAERALRHDLLTPVNHIVGYSEMLLEQADDEELDAYAGDLRRVHQAGRALAGLMNERLAGGLDLPRLRNDLAAPLGEAEAATAALRRQALAADRADIAADLDKIAGATARLRRMLDDAAAAPPRPARPPRKAAPAARAAPAAEGRLLLVDDNAENREMLLRRLGRLGYSAASAIHGRQALAMLREQSFDLVLLDIMMPEMDGYQTLAALKADERLRHIPVIILSASDDHASVVRCIEMGAEDHLPKPFDPVLLRARIGASLEKKRQHDRERRYTEEIRRAKARADALLKVVIPVGVALSAEKEFDRLLERIVRGAQELSNADGGTLYLRTADDRLEFVILRTTSLGIAMGGPGGTPITFPPLRMDEDGAPNHRFVVTHAALTGATVAVADAYAPCAFDFSGTREFDARTGYRSISFVAVPLKNAAGRVTGVLQLLNAQDPQTGAIVPFDPGQIEALESLSALAAVALDAYVREQRLKREIEQLRVEVDAVRTSRQVAEITESDYFRQLQAKARLLRGR